MDGFAEAIMDGLAEAIMAGMFVYWLSAPQGTRLTAGHVVRCSSGYQICHAWLIEQFCKHTNCLHDHKAFLVNAHMDEIAH